jgi:pyrroloquinoline quinone biosynthesis protein D
MIETSAAKPRFPRGVRLRFDSVRERHVLLYPEGALTLNETAVAVLELCDGVRTIDEISTELGSRYEADVSADVLSLLRSIADRGFLVDVE